MDLALAAKAVVLGIIEGVTEFLPISSTGHLVIAADLLDFADPGEVFTVVIQLGAILAVCFYYHRRLWQLVRGMCTGDGASWRFVANVLIAFIPAAIAGVLLDDWLDAHLFNPPTVAATMLLGGIAIIGIERTRHEPRWTDAAALPPRTALAIGLCQLLALVPGVSRSGASILGAMCLGVDRRAATEFSFFLAIPIMIGASGLKLFKHGDRLGEHGLSAIAIGFVVSFLVALAVVHWLLKFVARHDFVPFAWYRIVAGIALVVAIALGWIRSFPA
ncbi:MAG: undecaprenyl-diphosphate phosphatase [Planctomycetes bacterium]|nr:undecaprenyl-diphosphate phosphatase [Planctomycetota bacterium]